MDSRNRATQNEGPASIPPSAQLVFSSLVVARGEGGVDV